MWYTIKYFVHFGTSKYDVFQLNKLHKSQINE